MLCGDEWELPAVQLGMQIRSHELTKRTKKIQRREKKGMCSEYGRALKGMVRRGVRGVGGGGTSRLAAITRGERRHKILNVAWGKKQYNRNTHTQKNITRRDKGSQYYKIKKKNGQIVRNANRSPIKPRLHRRMKPERSLTMALQHLRGGGAQKKKKQGKKRERKSHRRLVEPEYQLRFRTVESERVKMPETHMGKNLIREWRFTKKKC